MDEHKPNEANETQHAGAPVGEMPADAMSGEVSGSEAVTFVPGEYFDALLAEPDQPEDAPTLAAAFARARRAPRIAGPAGA